MDLEISILFDYCAMDKAKENRLVAMTQSIDRMQKQHHIEILRILKTQSTENRVTINENRYGVYINLSFVPDATLNVLDAYIKYVQLQETTLESMELQKREIESIAFTSNGDE
jgi:hypothetical protein